MADIIAPERQLRSGGPGLSYWLGTKVVNQPLAMDEAFAGQLQQALKSAAFDGQFVPGASKFVGTRDIASRFRVTDDGIALVPVSGVLLDRGDWLGDLGGWATTYEGLAEQFRRLAKDPAIKSVVLDIDSGGGMVAGCFDLCAELAKLKRTKRVYAIAANMAASAAYAIGCVAHEFYVSRNGIAGSIGVIAIHTSYQRLLDQAGLDTTIICRGAHKSDGNPFQQLSHGARAEMASSIDRAFEQFVAHVAKERELDPAEVGELEARVYSGKLAVDAGLADGVKSFEELLEHIRKGASPSNPKSRKKGGRTVSEDNSAAAARPDHEAIIAAYVAGQKSQPTVTPPAAQTPAPAAAATPKPVDARERIKAILGHEAAAKRPSMANHLALETDLDVETCAGILGKAPEETPTAADATQAALGGSLAREMAKPGTSANIRPDATVGQPAAKPSLADKFTARFANMKKGA